MPDGLAHDAGPATPPGLGLSFNPALAAFVGRHADVLDYLEITPERFWHDGAPPAAAPPTGMSS